MSDFDGTRTDTLELAADQFDELGALLRQSGRENDAVHAKQIRIKTPETAYVLSATDGQVVVREE